MFDLKILKFLFKLYHNELPPYFNIYRVHLEQNIVPYTLRPHALPVPAVAHVYAESSLVYKLVVMKNEIAISDKLNIKENRRSKFFTDFIQSDCHQCNTK